jgi:hypothetical protein
MPRLGIQRGTATNIKFQGDVAYSDKNYPFVLEGESGRLYAFEAPIDALSLASILKMKGYAWKQDTYLVLDGLSPIGLDSYLARNPQIKQIIFCTDNDAAGQSVFADKVDAVTGEVTRQGFINRYMARGYSVGVFPPCGKDFNDDLTEMVHKAREPPVESTFDETEDFAPEA